MEQGAAFVTELSSFTASLARARSNPEVVSSSLKVVSHCIAEFLQKFLGVQQLSVVLIVLSVRGARAFERRAE